MILKYDDEPVLDPLSPRAVPAPNTGPPVTERIRRLVNTQPYGVLCTHGEDHAYGSLVAHAFAEDLSTAVFATPVATRKYRLLTEHDRVALVVDDRPENPDRMMAVEAITATGRARLVTAADERKPLAQLLLARHPQLRSFLASESCALFRVEILRYFHVARFQEVQQWVPGQV
jgi:nitroimidazol reductase NimA-like FMN-containing flavoprotein (pyridoxamine 5'-phosphate oxidase superfamily)